MSVPTFYDRVKETSATTGTGTLTLAGAVTGFKAFSVVGDGKVCYYVIDDGLGAWEVGLGTYTLSGTTLSRQTVFSSSNSNNLVNFTNALTVRLDCPAIALNAMNFTAAMSILQGIW